MFAIIDISNIVGRAQCEFCFRVHFPFIGPLIFLIWQPDLVSLICGLKCAAVTGCLSQINDLI